jgi:hypothetical protein
MPRRSALEVAKPEIERYFKESSGHVFMSTDIGAILRVNRATWRLPQSVLAAKFFEFLLDKTELRTVELISEVSANLTRYTWGPPSPFELALSLRKGAYLCHGSAVFLHGLTQDLPKTLYVNAEQSPKPTPSGGLSQDSLDLAFSGSPRMSRNTFSWDKLTFVLVSGKSTGRLEVGRLQGPDGESLEVTKLERTLIDIVVRPAYAGGVFKVLEAYTTARDRVSVNTLVATLKRLAYVYPYHQAIGFLMERAGYSPERLEPLRKLEMRFDFYLCHGIKDKDYDSRWRLFFPKGM